MNFRSIFTAINEAKVTEEDFLNSLLDIAESEPSIDYINMSTKDIIGELVTILRKNKKYSKLYDYWSKNRGQDLFSKIEKLFN